MAVTEETRHDLHVGLIDTLGRERATTLMELLPPVGWGDIATKQDLEHQVALQRNDFDHLRQDFGQLRQDFGQLRQDFDHHRDATRKDFDDFRAATKRESDALIERIDSRFAQFQFQMQSYVDRSAKDIIRTVVFATWPVTIAMAGVVIAAVRGG